MTINVTETLRKAMGWCPNATMKKPKTSQQTDFAHTSLKPSGRMNQEKEVKAIIVSVIAIFLFIISGLSYLLSTDISFLRTIMISLSIVGFGIIGIIGLLKIMRLNREKADRE